jgi:hypothetical protein
MCQLFQACRLCFNMIGIRFSAKKTHRTRKSGWSVGEQLSRATQ